MEEEGVIELDVPLGVLPATFPPGTGEGERATDGADLPLVRAGEDGEGVLVTAPFFGSDVDGDGWTLPF